jgi:hypothetical protein
MNGVILDSTITCPHCGHAETETMPTDACQFFYECKSCGNLLKPKQEDCCVFCSYGSVKCPPIQQHTSCCTGKDKKHPTKRYGLSNVLIDHQPSRSEEESTSAGRAFPENTDGCVGNACSSLPNILISLYRAIDWFFSVHSQAPAWKSSGESPVWRIQEARVYKT